MRRFLKIAIPLCLILLLAVGAYLNDYYHAGEVSAELLSSSEGIQPVERDGLLIFQPEEDTETNQGLIFYPGGKVEYTAYTPLMDALAKEGILCVVPEMPGNLAFLNLNAAEEILALFPEIEEWYLGGHSLGGVAAGSYAAKHSEELEGLVLLASYTTSDLTQTDLEVLSVYGSEDGVLNPESYGKNRANLPADTTEVVIQGGCHAYFGDYGEQKGDGVALISREAQTMQTVDAILELMED